MGDKHENISKLITSRQTYDFDVIRLLRGGGGGGAMLVVPLRKLLIFSNFLDVCISTSENEMSICSTTISYAKIALDNKRSKRGSM